MGLYWCACIVIMPPTPGSTRVMLRHWQGSVIFPSSGLLLALYERRYSLPVMAVGVLDNKNNSRLKSFFSGFWRLYGSCKTEFAGCVCFFH
jgi:hypothetical protein